MKNDMKLIMESWRSSEVVISEASESAAMHFAKNIDPVEFDANSIGQFLLDVTKVVTNGKSFQDVLMSSTKRLDDQVKTVEGKKAVGVFRKVLNFVRQRGTGYSLALFMSGFDFGAGLTALILSDVLVGSLENVTELSLNKLQDLRVAMNIPDSQRAQFPSADAWDVNDDLVKIIAGADKEYSRKEFTSIAAVYLKIIKALKKIEDEIETRYNDGRWRTIRDYLKQPLETVLKWDEGSANAAAQKKYAKDIDLSADYTIQKNPTATPPTPTP